MRLKFILSGLPLCIIASSTCVNARDSVLAATSGNGIIIISGSFGSLGQQRKLDISRRLAEVCGAGSVSCQLFCSETSFGRYNLGRAPICRVTYRCGSNQVRSVEAMREEPLLLRCPDAEAEAPGRPLAEPN